MMPANTNASRRRDAAAVIAATVLIVVALCTSASSASSASAAATATTSAETCAASGTQTPTGSKLISGPMLPQITSSALPMSIPTSVAATPQINPGGTISTTATFQLDLATVAADILEHRVRPAVAAAGYPTLAPTAWDVVDLHAITVSLPLPTGTTPVGSPVAASSATATSAAFTAGGVTLTADHVQGDTRAPATPISLTMTWAVVDDGAPAPRPIALHPGPITFTADISVGVLFYGSPVLGGVNGPWTCTPDDPAAVLATTEAITAATTTAPSTTGPHPSSTTVATTLPPTTTTTWPSTTTTPPRSCAVSGFDRYGGFAGIDLGATGYFHTGEHGGRWWLIDPDGHPFFSQGINHVTFAGTPDQFGATAYQDAVTQKYGTPQRWADAQVGRMQQWGYNTLGAWSDADLFAGREPYTVLLDITAEDFGTGVMEDLWAPAWEASVHAAVAAKVTPARDDPYLLGYWTDNELHWGPDWRPVHLFEEYAVRPATTPGKQAWLTFLHQRYPTFSAFAADFTTTATDWATLGDPTTVTVWTTTGGEATRAAWVHAVAERYFSFTSGAIKAADPHHLNLGPRLIAQVTGRPVLEVAAHYVDVASFNDYAIIPELAAPLRNADPTYLSVDDGLAAQEQILRKPIIVSEWSFRAADSGLPNSWPPLFPTLQTQDQRAAAYESFTTSLLHTDWVVGQHWFEHADEPPAGRPGGEDSNFGLVNLADDPYGPVVAISKTMHDCAYARLLAPGPSTTTPSPTSSVPPSAPAPPSPSSPSSPSSTDAAIAPAAAEPATAVAATPLFTR